MLPSNSSVGLLVTIDSAPAMLFLPNSTFCGPRSTSTRFKSRNGIRASGARPRAISSTYCTTLCSKPWLIPEPIPRITRKLPIEASDFWKLGTYAVRSARSIIPASCILAPLTALTDNGTSINDCTRFWAVTTTSSKARSWADTGITSAIAATSGVTALTVREIVFEYMS